MDIIHPVCKQCYDVITHSGLEEEFVERYMEDDEL